MSRWDALYEARAGYSGSRYEAVVLQRPAAYLSDGRVLGVWPFENLPWPESYTVVVSLPVQGEVTGPAASYGFYVSATLTGLAARVAPLYFGTTKHLGAGCCGLYVLAAVEREGASLADVEALLSLRDGAAMYLPSWPGILAPFLRAYDVDVLKGMRTAAWALGDTNIATGRYLARLCNSSP